MNPLRLCCLLVAGLWFIAPVGAAEKAAADKAPAAPAGPARIPAARFKQVRDRAAALFQSRNQPPADPVPVENPLRTVADVARPSGDTEPARNNEPAPTELDTLQQAVATLRVSGMFEKDGTSYLAINSKPYRVGDVVPTVVQGETIYLRVREIDRNSITLALNDTEVTLKDFGGGAKKKAAPAPAR